MPPSKTSKIALFSDWTPETLAEKRKELGFNKTQMSEALGVTYRQYLYYESGHTKLSKALEHHVNDMLGVTSQPSKSPGTLTDFQRERIEMLLDAIKKYPTSNLDEKGQKILQQSVSEISTLMAVIGD